MRRGAFKSPRFGAWALILAVLAVLGLPSLGRAQGPAWPAGIPKQPSDPVTDLAGMLSPGAADHLNQALRRQWREGHFQLAVLILPSLQDRPLEDLSIQVARGWALGDKQASNGVLLLVAAKEHRMRIEVGSRLEGTLPDILCRRIIEDGMAPLMRRGDFDGALLTGVAEITAVLAPQDPLASQAPAQGAPLGKQASPGGAVAAVGILGLLFWLLGQPFFWIVLLWLLVIALRGGGGFYGGGWGGGGFGGGGFGGGGGGFGGGGGGFSGGGSSGGW